MLLSSQPTTIKEVSQHAAWCSHPAPRNGSHTGLRKRETPSLSLNLDAAPRGLLWSNVLFPSLQLPQKEEQHPGSRDVLPNLCSAVTPASHPWAGGLGMDYQVCRLPELSARSATATSGSVKQPALEDFFGVRETLEKSRKPGSSPVGITLQLPATSAVLSAFPQGALPSANKGQSCPLTRQGSKLSKPAHCKVMRCGELEGFCLKAGPPQTPKSPHPQHPGAPPCNSKPPPGLTSSQL